MNTEINLLDKKTNKYQTPLFLGAIFVVGLALITGLLYYQHDGLTSEIAADKNAITELEIVLAEYNQKYATQDKLKRLAKEVDVIKQDQTPHVEIYYGVIGLLPQVKQMSSYTTGEQTSLTINASFPKLDDIARYVEKLVAEDYVLDAELTQVSHTDPTYDATLTLEIDRERLVEELAAP